MHKHQTAGFIVAGLSALLLIWIGVQIVSENQTVTSVEPDVTTDVGTGDREVLSKLGTIMELPSDIVPIMAIITDVAAVQKQQPAFFAKARNGHRLIVYPDMAILYDYEGNKIIHSGPVNFNAVATQTKPVVTEDPTEVVETPSLPSGISFQILNGSGVAGDAAAYARLVQNTFTSPETSTGNAAGKYAKTLVVDMSDGAVDVDQIAKDLGVNVGALPAGENVTSDALVLIFVGSDFVAE
jgi:hypothetical protein